MASHLRYYEPYHDGVEYVRERLSLDGEQPMNGDIPVETQTFLREIGSRPMNEATAYALYWLARNSLYLGLAEDRRIRLIGYRI